MSLSGQPSARSALCLLTRRIPLNSELSGTDLPLRRKQSHYLVDPLGCLWSALHRDIGVRLDIARRARNMRHPARPGCRRESKERHLDEMNPLVEPRR
jgi:hypothetical protein